MLGEVQSLAAIAFVKWVPRVRRNPGTAASRAPDGSPASNRRVSTMTSRSDRRGRAGGPRGAAYATRQAEKAAPAKIRPASPNRFPGDLESRCGILPVYTVLMPLEITGSSFLAGSLGSGGDADPAAPGMRGVRRRVASLSDAGELVRRADRSRPGRAAGSRRRL